MMLTDDQHRIQTRPSTALLLGAPLVLLGGPLTAMLLPADAMAAPGTYTVTNLNAAGVGSLAEAISTSESNPGTDTIVFDPSLTGTITLSSEFDLTQDLVIDGGGRITLDGGGAVRHFDLLPSSQKITLRGLTLTNGRAASNGGSVHATTDVDLVIDDVTFTGNTVTGASGRGGAVSMEVGSSLSISDSTFTGNSVPTGVGGAISMFSWGAGEFSMTKTIVTGNTQTGNGSVYVEVERTTITDSVISNNTTTGVGEGFNTGANLTGAYILVDGLVMENNEGSALEINRGGFVDVDVRRLSIDGAERGLFLNTVSGAKMRLSDSSIANTSSLGILTNACFGDIVIESTTITGSAGPALDAQGGGLYCEVHSTLLRHSTVSGNVIGIITTSSEPGDVELDHTIVAGNTVDLASDVDARWSLVQRPDGHLRSAVDTLVGVDPRLRPAARVGALMVCTFDESSPAFNTGNPAFTPPPTTDEVGQTRVAFGRIDIGAWELQPSPEPVVPSFTG